MKATTILIVVGLVGAAFYFGNLAVAGNVLQYVIQSVDFSGISSGTITLIVQNPSNATIMLNSMAGTVSVNNTTIGNISNFAGGVEIPANSQRPVVVDVQLSLLNIAGTLAAMLISPTGQNQLNFQIAGNANMNAGTIVPFSITQTLTV